MMIRDKHYKYTCIKCGVVIRCRCSSKVHDIHPPVVANVICDECAKKDRLKISSYFEYSQLIEAQKHSGAMVALTAPDSVRKGLDKLGLLKAPGVEPDNLHITLLYLGKANDIDRPRLRRLIQALKDTCAKHAPIQIKIGGIGKFQEGPDGIPIWASATGPGLSQLQGDLEKVVGQIMALPSEHGWVPHLTLGYLKPGSDYALPDVTRAHLPQWEARDVKLVMADESVDSFPLAAEPQRKAKVENVKFRPDLILVFRMQPSWFKGRDKGFWFVMDAMPAEVAEVFKDLTAHNKGRNQSAHRFYSYKEDEYAGWWTLSASSAATAHKMLEYKGYSLEYKQGLPFDREPPTFHRPLPHEVRWRGDYEILKRGLGLLLSFSDLKKKDREHIDSYWKHLNKQGWLNEAQVENLKKIMRRPPNLKWLKLKGYTRRKTIYDASSDKSLRRAKDKPCPPGRHEGPRNRCITETQEDAIIRQRKQRRKHMQRKHEQQDKTLDEQQKRKRKRLQRKQNRQVTRTQIASREEPDHSKGTQAKRWDDHYPYAGVPSLPALPGLKETQEEFYDQGLSITRTLREERHNGNH